MSAWSTKTLGAISKLAGSVDGVYSVKVTKHDGKPPPGKKQRYEGDPVSGVKYEWVDQSTGGGFTGDEFAGTVTFILGDYHLTIWYST